MKATPRKHKIIIQRQIVTGEDEYGQDIIGPGIWTTEYAAIFYGNGREQRQAAQEGGSQTASFEVLSNAKTRAISVTDKVLYPLSDPDPEKWPAWDIQAFNELGFNEGVRITATRAAN